MADSDQSVAMKTVTKLLLSAEHYASISPALARFYVLEVERLKKKLCLPLSTVSQVCPYCRTIRRPGNCTRRLWSKMKTGQQIRRLEKKNAEGRGVGKFGKMLLDLYFDGANRLQIRCHCCGKRTFVRGACWPAKVPKADRPAGRNSEAEVLKTKKKRRKERRTVESNTKVADISSHGREMEARRPNQRPLRPETHEKGRVTNKKETLKQRHNMLQNILKRKMSSASPDTSAALKSFLLSL